MKSVLISIQPKWCELIASGKKTIEVRKTKPKLDVPFKVYIYCTIDEPLYQSGEKFWCESAGEFGNGKVIGEFVCDEITPLFNVATTSWNLLAGNVHEYAKGLVKMACLTEEEMHEYAKGKNCYAWHMSDRVIYDTPKELGEYIVPSKIGCCNEGKCRGCKWFDRGNGFDLEDDCNAKFDTDEYKPLRRAPQSWCYVEELK